ncbi:hypothetical protein BRIN106911_24125 [Brevibacillus invocatus]
MKAFSGETYVIPEKRTINSMNPEKLGPSYLNAD